MIPHVYLDMLLSLAAQAWPELVEAARAELRTVDLTNAELWAAVERGAILADKVPSFERDAELARFLHELRILYRITRH